MAKYTTKRKYTKKPTPQLKKTIKRIKKEVVDVAEVVAVEAKPVWQKIKDWFKSIAG